MRAEILLPQTRRALETLGLLVSQGRRQRGWTAADLAERVGVTPKTLAKVEHGDPSVSLGVALEAAALVGVELIAPADDLASVRERERDRLALLPQRVRKPASRIEVDDDF